MAKLTVEIGDDELVFPAHYEVCPRCGGEGVHDHPHVTGISQEQFDEDPDFEEAYFRGDYDVTCSVCKGKRVVLEIDEDKANPEDLAKWREWQEAKRQHQAEIDSERRMGA